MGWLWLAGVALGHNAAELFLATLGSAGHGLESWRQLQADPPNLTWFEHWRSHGIIPLLPASRAFFPPAHFEMGCFGFDEQKQVLK